MYNTWQVSTVLINSNVIWGLERQKEWANFMDVSNNETHTVFAVHHTRFLYLWIDASKTCSTIAIMALVQLGWSAVLCSWATYSPKSTGNTQEAVAPSRHDWTIVDWDVEHQHKQTSWVEHDKSLTSRPGEWLRVGDPFTWSTHLREVA